MHRVAAKVTQKVGMFFQHQGVDSGAPQQVPEHHAGRPAAGNAAADLNFIRHETEYTRSLGPATGAPMMRRLISSGSRFEQDIGYSRAVVDGEWVFVSGTTGFDYETMTISDSLVGQCEQALKNVQAALRQANAELAD